MPTNELAIVHYGTLEPSTFPPVFCPPAFKHIEKHIIAPLFMCSTKEVEASCRSEYFQLNCIDLCK